MNTTKIKIIVVIAVIAIFTGFVSTSAAPNIKDAAKKTADGKKTKSLIFPKTEVWLTAYSSTPEETDNTPYITASGERVRGGIVAVNFLPFGTKVQIPEIFGDKIFVVKDRMHHRKTNFVDVWMPSQKEAKEFGIYETEIVILDIPSSQKSVLAESL